MTASKPAPSSPAGPTQPPSGPRHPTPTGPSPTGPSRPSGHLPYGYSDPRDAAPIARERVPAAAGVGPSHPSPPAGECRTPGYATAISATGESVDARHSVGAGADSGPCSGAPEVGAGIGATFSLPQPKPFDIAVNESLARRSR